MEGADLFPVECRHLGMKKGRRHLFGKLLLKLGLPVLKLDHLGVDPVRRAALEDQIKQRVQLALDPLQLRPRSLDRRRAFRPKTIHLTSEFVAEFLEQSRVH
ncbi:hypothetical protein [Bradyrhizobium sp. BWA-3-5]|uniref:hypothetical protein n=1 Tax=Bradyrhizobium sp. BWA-3-5 TaxID=3080013 RepID=UPI00293E3DEE|nr:hypothetical protein [Bradyrhizobium sp. BWA-3-5]WOH67105.1 hypothetical protein RX331_04880 [Bradyrhizobium sp. BWA-3-5]